MGYTVTVPIKSKSAHAKMLAFLEANYRPWSVVGEQGGGEYLRGPLGEDLSYDSGKCRIGFDYNAGGAERLYAFTIVKWMALRVGRRLRNGLPYYVYDGYENCPVYTKGRHSDANRVDKYGVPVYDKSNLCRDGTWRVKAELDVTDEFEALDLIRAEMKRLDKLWEAQQ
jgi:hypothetical protein